MQQAVHARNMAYYMHKGYISGKTGAQMGNAYSSSSKHGRLCASLICLIHAKER